MSSCCVAALQARGYKAQYLLKYIAEGEVSEVHQLVHGS
jgi:hypothetical protein